MTLSHADALLVWEESMEPANCAQLVQLPAVMDHPALPARKIKFWSTDSVSASKDLPSTLLRSALLARLFPTGSLSMEFALSALEI